MDRRTQKLLAQTIQEIDQQATPGNSSAAIRGHLDVWDRLSAVRPVDPPPWATAAGKQRMLSALASARSARTNLLTMIFTAPLARSAAIVLGLLLLTGAAAGASAALGGPNLWDKVGITSSHGPSGNENKSFSPDRSSKGTAGTGGINSSDGHSPGSTGLSTNGGPPQGGQTNDAPGGVFDDSDGHDDAPANSSAPAPTPDDDDDDGGGETPKPTRTPAPTKTPAPTPDDDDDEDETPRPTPTPHPTPTPTKTPAPTPDDDDDDGDDSHDDDGHDDGDGGDSHDDGGDGGDSHGEGDGGDSHDDGGDSHDDSPSPTPKTSPDDHEDGDSHDHDHHHDDNDHPTDDDALR